MTIAAPISRIAPTPLGYVDHAAFSGLGVRLVYGLRADGVLVHVSQVPSGLACACVCPACGQRLRAHKGKIRVEHFVHQDQGAACGVGAETNAHYWAKGVLERQKKIRLPAVGATKGQASLTLFSSQIFEFDDVRVEQRMGQIVPDLILRKGDRQLIVEVYVTHRCGPEKIDKIRAGGVSALEVDLSGYRQCDDEAKIAKAFLDTANRAWLYNPQQTKAASALNQRLKTEAAEAEAKRQRRLRRQVEQVRAARGSVSDEMDSHHAALTLLARDHCRDVPTPAVDGFIVPTEYWQSEIYWRVVVLPVLKRETWTQIDADRILDTIEDCLAPPLRGPGSHTLRSGVVDMAPPYRPPARAIEAYLEALQEFGVLTYDRRSGGPIVSPLEREHVRARVRAERAAADREKAMRERVTAILARLPNEDTAGFDLETWLGGEDQAPAPRDLWSDPAEIAWEAFLDDLARIERMLDGTCAPEDLLGLPFLREAQRVERRIADAAAARKRAADEKRVQDASDRLVHLRNRVVDVVGAEAVDWLNRLDPASGRTPAILALEGIEGAWKAHGLLDEILRVRAAADGQRQRAADCLGKLRRAALKVYDEAHADVFLNSGHPALDGLAPRLCCLDDEGLALCRALLPKKPQKSAL